MLMRLLCADISVFVAVSVAESGWCLVVAFAVDQAGFFLQPGEKLLT